MANAYLTIHAGAGGTEACDWVAMLARMYERYARSCGPGLVEMARQPGAEAGIKHVAYRVRGDDLVGRLANEVGVHRLSRKSPYGRKDRRQTSFAAVDLFTEVGASEVVVNDSDLTITTYRGSGPGGQHRNTTDSAVRILHGPSGVVVRCENERSQHANRSRAVKMLRARLAELDQRRRDENRREAYDDKGEIAWGRQIRSYVVEPKPLVKDHRTGVKTSDVSGVLNGDLRKFIEAMES